jgi:hypothetical protein
MPKFPVVLLLASAISLSASAAPFPAPPMSHDFISTTGTAGWQKPVVVTIDKGAAPAGVINYSCPSNFPVALSGSETFNAAGQSDVVVVDSDGLKLKNGKTQTGTWSFHLRWPSGVKTKEAVTVNVYCQAQ